MKTTHPTPTQLPQRPAMARWLALALLASSTALAQQTSLESESASSEEVVTLPEFTVTTESDQGYIVRDAISGGRAGTKITVTPFSVQTLTNEFMNDFQLF